MLVLTGRAFARRVAVDPWVPATSICGSRLLHEAVLLRSLAGEQLGVGGPPSRASRQVRYS